MREIDKEPYNDIRLIKDKRSIRDHKKGHHSNLKEIDQ